MLGTGDVYYTEPFSVHFPIVALAALCRGTQVLVNCTLRGGNILGGCECVQRLPNEQHQLQYLMDFKPDQPYIVLRELVSGSRSPN